MESARQAFNIIANVSRLPPPPFSVYNQHTRTHTHTASLTYAHPPVAKVLFLSLFINPR